MKIEFAERFDIPSATAQQRGHGAHGRTWESPGLRYARAAWQALFERHRPARPLAGAVSVIMVLYYHRKGVDKVALKTTRPDIDNVAKVVLDALMAAKFIMDDAAVFRLDICKLVHDKPDSVVFTIQEVDGENNDEQDTRGDGGPDR